MLSHLNAGLRMNWDMDVGQGEGVRGVSFVSFKMICLIAVTMLFASSSHVLVQFQKIR